MTLLHQNIEAEQALLGVALLNNEVVDRVAGIVKTDDLADPVHQAIWDRILIRRSQDQLATPITIRNDFEAHPGLAELGGPAYLARLAGAAISVFAAKDYATLIAELARKRRLAERLQAALADLDDPDKDAAAVLGGIEAHSLTEDSKSGAEIISFTAATTAALKSTTDAHNGDGPAVMKTGIAKLDAMIGGFHPGDLVILGGRPGMGKSSLALAFALHAAREGFGVAFSSLEMTPESLALRAISEETDRQHRGVPYADARKGILGDTQFDNFRSAAMDIHALPIRIIPPSVRDLGSLYAAVRRVMKQCEAKGIPFGAVVVDYLQLLRVDRRSRFEEITEISIALKQMALQFKIPVIALSQLSRQVEQRDDKRPTMSDLRESGQLEQDADLILFCYRDEYYLRREEPDSDDPEHAGWWSALNACAGWMDIIVAKQRMGETGSILVRYDERTNSVRGGAS
jgi:replicative DNA helicase